MYTGAGRAIALTMLIIASYRSEVPATEAAASTVPRPMNSVGLEYGALSTNGFDQSQYGVRSKIKLFGLGDGEIYARIGGEYISTDEDGYFPSNLYNLTVALGMRDNDNMAELMLNSRGDRPFHSMDEVSAGMYAFHRVWPRPHGGLFAGLIYFPFERIIPEEVMPVNVPFPFLMYLHAAPGLFVMVGIPTILRWSPAEFLFLDFQYLPSRNITAWAGVRAGPAFRAGPGFVWRQRNFLIAGREHKEEKLYQDHKQAGLKVSYRLFYVLELSLFG
ncbi:MAG: hypothetical protein MUC76_07485, partial [Spirochaetes bacterium]|nr:hypothetical protein [Spirochaetota bacterium]